MGVEEAYPDEFPTPDLLDIQPMTCRAHSSPSGATERRG
jgi:hypothetical protein